jgi:hypothetical protein
MKFGLRVVFSNCRVLVSAVKSGSLTAVLYIGADENSVPAFCIVPLG